MQKSEELVLKPHSGWQPIDLQEFWSRRELLRFLIWRDIKIRYKQTVLGGLWAILQPLPLLVRAFRIDSQLTPMRVAARRRSASCAS